MRPGLRSGDLVAVTKNCTRCWVLSEYGGVAASFFRHSCHRLWGLQVLMSKRTVGDGTAAENCNTTGELSGALTLCCGACYHKASRAGTVSGLLRVRPRWKSLPKPNACSTNEAFSRMLNALLFGRTIYGLDTQQTAPCPKPHL